MVTAPHLVRPRPRLANWLSSFLLLAPSRALVAVRPFIHAVQHHPLRQRSSAAAAADGAGAQLVWLTGAEDLRLSDHGGFEAASAAGAVVPVFVLDPAVHLSYPPPRLRRLHRALSSLEAALSEEYGVTLVVRRGGASAVLPQVAQECGATACQSGQRCTRAATK